MGYKVTEPYHSKVYDGWIKRLERFNLDKYTMVYYLSKAMLSIMDSRVMADDFEDDEREFSRPYRTRAENYISYYEKPVNETHLHAFAREIVCKLDIFGSYYGLGINDEINHLMICFGFKPIPRDIEMTTQGSDDRWQYLLEQELLTRKKITDTNNETLAMLKEYKEKGHIKYFSTRETDGIHLLGFDVVMHENSSLSPEELNWLAQTIMYKHGVTMVERGNEYGFNITKV